MADETLPGTQTQLPGTQPPADQTQTQKTPEQIAAETAKKTETPPTEFKPDPNKTALENEAAKKVFDEAAKKPADEKKTALGKDAEKKKDEANTAPEKYEPFTLPDGFQMDEEALKEFTPIAKELDLSQERAQKLVTLEAGLRANHAKRWQETVTGWDTESKKDTEFGGAKYDESVAIANKALDEFGTPELRKLMNDYGIGNHKEMIRSWWRVGQALGEGRVRTTNEGLGGEKKEAKEVLYGSTPA